jgi:hypothetical protein
MDQGSMLQVLDRYQRLYWSATLWSCLYRDEGLGVSTSEYLRAQAKRELTNLGILVHRHLWYFTFVSTPDSPILYTNGQTIIRIVRPRLLPTQLRHQDERFRSRFRNARTIGCVSRD